MAHSRINDFLSKEQTGQPEDVADVIVFLASEQARWLTSQLLYITNCFVIDFYGDLSGTSGIGKSVLATQVMHRVAQDFEVIIWRSLRDVPSCEALLDDCL